MNTNYPSESGLLPPQKPSVERMIEFGVWLGLAMVVLAVVWVRGLREESLVAAWFGSESALHILRDITMGGVIGASFSGTVWIFGRRLSSFQKIREKLSAALDFRSMRLGHIVAISLLAAIPEEIFFRGAMQPVFGVALTAVVFGLLHAVSPTYFFYAASAGLGLGLMVEAQGSLWMAIGAHFATDFVSMLLLVRWSRQQVSEVDQLDARFHPTVHLEPFQ